LLEEITIVSFVLTRNEWRWKVWYFKKLNLNFWGFITKLLMQTMKI